jgi:hypothetical protein
MPNPVLVAMVSAQPGEEAAFNEWYAEHLAEVRGVPGIAGAQRYRVAATQAPGMPEPPHPNLALYEIEGDPELVLGEIVRRRRDGEWSPRRGIDESSIGMWVFEPVGERGQLQG